MIISGRQIDVDVMIRRRHVDEGQLRLRQCRLMAFTGHEIAADIRQAMWPAMILAAVP